MHGCKAQFSMCASCYRALSRSTLIVNLSLAAMVLSRQILRVLLAEETVSDEVDLNKLAERTNRYR
jgi:hypothetical protein